MARFNINGQWIESTEENKKLLNFLRRDLQLVGTKDGCNSGACGTCTVLIDGKATKACVPTLAKIDGKQVITIEGITEREQDVYAYAFAKCGAVQCGFCIPGMVICAKGLIATNDDPSPLDVKKALRTNICRCTGYVKIEEAILLAAKILREDTAIPEYEFSGKVGENFFRLDAREKTLGTGVYVDDITLDDMLFAKALRTPYPRAMINRIDILAASEHRDCIKVILADDVPGLNKHGHLVPDWDVLIKQGTETRYVGDALALVVSKKEESLDEILSLIKLECEELTPICSPLESLAEGAYQIHPSGNLLREEILDRGNVDAALKKAIYIETNHFSVPFTEHAFMEPECAIATIDGDGILLYTASQSIYDEQKEIGRILGIEEKKVNIHSCLVGGGFGGKEDMSVQHHAALASWITKLPVKVKLSRDESISIHPKRHAMEIDCTVGCDENGKILAAKFEILSDGGAYASLGGPVLQRACTHAGGPYNFQDFYVRGRCLYTNNPPGGAFRGFGVTQSCFAMESTLNMLAEKIGISPWEIRYRNAVRAGEVLPNGQIADGTTGIVKCLNAVKENFEKAEYPGIACGFKNSGLGVGLPDISRCIISIENGKAHVRNSAACIGQGMITIIMQMFCETTGLAPNMAIIETPDTRRTPDAGTTTASRQTLLTGEAVSRAGRLLKAELDSGKSLEDLEGREFYDEYFGKTDPMGSDVEFPVSHVAYGYSVQLVELNESGEVIKVTVAEDLGRVVNPKAAEGQIEGGVAMGLGYGLTEDYPLDNGVPTAKYGKLGLWRSTQMPEINVKFIDTDEFGEYAYGAKGVGELAAIPTAPACQGAYYALDGVFRTKLPLDDTFYRKPKKA